VPTVLVTARNADLTPARANCPGCGTNYQVVVDWPYRTAVQDPAAPRYSLPWHRSTSLHEPCRGAELRITATTNGS
jgi:hypothetical protein